MRPKEDIRLFGKEIERINGIRFYEGYYQKRLCYGVQQLSTGYAAVFNHCKQLLNDLVNLVRGGVNICRANGNNLHIFIGSEKYMSLAAYLFCKYNGMEADTARFSNYLCHSSKRRNKLIENCRADNLCFGGATMVINEASGTFSIISNAKGYVDEFEPIPLLQDILSKQNTVLYWNSSNRLMCHIKGQFGFAIADLAYLAYYDDLTMDNYIEKLAELKQYKKDNGLNMEHLDGNYHNHRKYNIALVAEGMNSKKNDLISHIKEPYFFTIVYDKGKFKIVLGKADDDLMLDGKLFITEHFEKVVKLLLEYRDLYPNIFSKDEAVANNEGLFYEPFFCEAIVNTANERFKSLDEL